ncbi:CBS domain protein [Rhizobium azibense]|uniref:CBS domain protein n=2 Tax=Rhizobium TaxID=379 RepID=A0A4R3R7Q7_9HYPH|nr:CBS domain protein [Rhizobium azibense]TCU37804.1 CBS domain protein [Rhizobium azibense]
MAEYTANVKTRQLSNNALAKEAQMFVGEIMKNKGVGVIAVDRDQTMVEVLRLFRENNIGFVVVGQSDGEYLGSLSERDCCNAIAEYGAAAAMMRAADIMNRNVATCSTRDLLPVAMGIMTRRRTRHVLVMDGDNVVGVVSIGDVVKHRLDEAQRTEQDLQDYICGTRYH